MRFYDRTFYSNNQLSNEISPYNFEVYDHPLLVQRGKAVSESLEFGFQNKLTQKSCLLDLGCGLGPYFVYYKRYNCLAIGTDVDSLRLKTARQRALNMHVPSAFVRCDAKHLPFKENVFDAVVVAEVLEHMNEPSTVLLGIQRCVKCNGHVIITVPWLREFRLLSFPSILFLREITLLKAGHPGPFFKILFRDVVLSVAGKKSLRLRKFGILNNFLLNIARRNGAFIDSFRHFSSLSFEEFVLAFAFGGFPKYFGHQVLYTPNEWKRVVNNSGFTVCYETGALLFPLQLWNLKSLRYIFSAAEPKANKSVRKWLSQSYVIVARSIE